MYIYVPGRQEFPLIIKITATCRTQSQGEQSKDRMGGGRCFTVFIVYPGTITRYVEEAFLKKLRRMRLICTSDTRHIQGAPEGLSFF
jgi:hypothetical protein